MRIFKTRWFDKWAAKQGLTDKVLVAAIREVENGLVDADLGGHVYKKRVALPGRGKSGGLRTLIAFRAVDRAFFVYGFAKSERTNISTKELKALRLLAEQLLSYTPPALTKGLQAEELTEVPDDAEE